jgi:CO/xanthine dehydrogenase FAD-binding subunit
MHLESLAVAMGACEQVVWDQKEAGLLRSVKHYRRPESVEDAVALVQSNHNAAYLAGGAWTVARGDPGLEMVVDLQDLGLDFIESTLEVIRFGAAVSLQAIIDHADSGELANGLLRRATQYVQSRNLREQGTLGGTLMTAGSEDPLTTALLVLDVETRYADPVVHRAPFMSFVAYRDRLISTRVLLTELSIKRPLSRSAGAFEVVGRSPTDKPVVCAAAFVSVSEGLPEIVRVAVGGLAERPVRLHKTEHILRGQLLGPDRISHALEPALSELEAISDYRGSADYRLAMAKVVSRRALLGAWQKARR